MSDALDDDLAEQIGRATRAIGAIKQLRRESPSVDMDSVLAKAEYGVRGVRDQYITEMSVPGLDAVLEDFREQRDE